MLGVPYNFTLLCVVIISSSHFATSGVITGLYDGSLVQKFRLYRIFVVLVDKFGNVG